jgi:minor extracellular serine protease Vpr
LPFSVSPRGLSNVLVGKPTPYGPGPDDTVTRSVDVFNKGLHDGAADVYAWGLVDPADAGGPHDVRAVGVQVHPGEVAGLDPSDRLLVFAVNTHERWSSASTTEIDVAIDAGGDGITDALLVGVDFGLVTTGVPDGRFAAAVLSPEGELIDAFLADAPMNGSTVLLPAAASSLGLGKSSRLDYTVGSFSFETSGSDEVSGVGHLDYLDPAVSQGQLLALAPGESAPLDQVVSLAAIETTPALGWLVVALDDPNGGFQADLVPIGDL